MRVKTKEMIGRVKTLLTEEQYQKANQIAKAIRSSIGTVFRIIRLMRETGIGVHWTKSGYTLSQHATKKDDVDYLHRLCGRRASDYIAIKAAEPHLRHRWNSVTDRRNLGLILSPLNANQRALSSGMKLLSDKRDGKL